MIEFLFVEPPAEDCLFYRLYPSGSRAYQQLLDACSAKQIRAFTITAVQKGIPLPLALAQPLLDCINEAQQASYTFADLPLRLQKDVPLDEIQNRIVALNQLRRQLSRAATSQALTDMVTQISRALRWFKYRSLPLFYQAAIERYDLAMPTSPPVFV